MVSARRERDDPKEDNMRRITGVRRLLVVSVLALVVAVPGVAGASASRGAAPGTKLTFSTPGFQ